MESRACGGRKASQRSGEDPRQPPGVALEVHDAEFFVGEEVLGKLARWSSGTCGRLWRATRQRGIELKLTSVEGAEGRRKEKRE